MLIKLISLFDLIGKDNYVLKCIEWSFKKHNCTS